MSLLDNANISKTPDPSPQELLAEARAWGFDTVEEFFEAVDEAYQQAEEEEGL